ncbi:hypothetical protein GW17_00040443 [Ensete ventricosum]|nr:hypothetical protein GW17_00040443 [Ensete ventricosum]
MAFMAVLESDLRALSVEARRRYPAVKDGAEHAILKVTLRSLSSPNEIAHDEDILRIFLMACDVSLLEYFTMMFLICFFQHAEITDESVQHKTLQTILIVFQSHLHPLEEVSKKMT